MAPLAQGTHAPDFTLIGADLKHHNLREQLEAGGPVLAVIFKVNCPTCQLAFPFLERLAHAYAGEHWQLWGISQNNRDLTLDFKHRYKISFPLLDDSALHVSRLYNPDTTPTHFLIETNGKISRVQGGWSSAFMEELSENLAHRFHIEPPAPMVTANDAVPSFKPG